MVGQRNFPLIQAHVDDIVVVSEAAIVAAMRRIWEVLKIVVEASGAVPFAAVLERRVALPGPRVGIILSGGNVDLDRLPWIPSSAPPPAVAASATSRT
jgi:threonine dehydratase